MPRRPHSKSRQGCLRCKRQHVKCDESWPTCTRCAGTSQLCEYVSQPRASSHSSTTTPSIASLPPAGPEPAPDEAKIDLTQIELFHHFTAHLCGTFMRTPAEGALYLDMITPRALQNAPLMRQLLAMSALHYSLVRKDQSQFYRDLADSLHSSALSSFNVLIMNIDKSNCAEALLFGHLIAIFVFCTTFAATPLDDLNASLDHIVGCIRLLKGVTSVMRAWWDVLRHTECGIFVGGSDAYQESPKPSRDELAYLKPLLASANLRATAITVCEEALDGLQRYIDTDNLLSEDGKSTHMAFAWLMVMNEDFITLVEERRPEALALLGCYAGLLHRRRSNWVIGPAGGKLLASVRKSLGGSWDGWLAWPSEVIGDEHSSPADAF